MSDPTAPPPGKAIASALRPCPFCGGKPALHTNAHATFAYCPECDAHGRSFLTDDDGDGHAKPDAIAAWNRRISAPAEGQVNVAELQERVAARVELALHGCDAARWAREEIADHFAGIPWDGAKHEHSPAPADGAAGELAKRMRTWVEAAIHPFEGDVRACPIADKLIAAALPYVESDARAPSAVASWESVNVEQLKADVLRYAEETVGPVVAAVHAESALAAIDNFFDCPHHSWSGDEGSVEKLGHFPRRWRCDHCGFVRQDPPSAAQPTDGERE